MVDPITTSKTLYDLFDAWGGEYFDFAVARRWEEMPREQLISLAEMYAEWQPNLFHLPPLMPGQLRPYVYRWQSPTRPPQYPGRPSTISLLRRVLLYSHSAVVDVGLVRPESVLQSAAQLGRWDLPNFSELAEVRPLVNSGALHLVSATRFSGERLFMSPRATGIESGWGSTNLWFDDLPARELLPSERLAEWLDASMQLDHAFSGVTGHHVQMLFSSRKLERLFAQLVSDANEWTGEPELGANYQLQSLLRLKVPELQLPRIEDLVLLRGNEDIFVSWRTALGDGLRDLSLAAAANTQPGHAHALLRERLVPEASRLTAAVQRSSVLSSATTGLSAFALSAVGTGVASTLGEALVPNLVGNLAAGSAGAIAKYVVDLRKKKINSALLAHYLTFTRA